MKDFQTVRGFRDIDPEYTSKLMDIYDKFTLIAKQYNITEIITPTVEFASLFQRTVGDNSDIVKKEMFFLQSEKESLVLKPEGTAGIARYLINKGIFRGRYFTFDKFFRRERPQKGRYREFYSISVEFIGKNEYTEDIECLQCFIDLAKIYDINYTLNVNSIGTIDDRKIYEEEFKKYLQINYDKLSTYSKERFNNNNILRILDSKHDAEILQNAPNILNFICKESKEKFNLIIKYLIYQNINYKINHNIVRGLDYYNDLVFEFIDNSLDFAQSTICGGGRYDGLFETLESQKTPAIGFGIGLDRMIEGSKFNIGTRKKVIILDETGNIENIQYVNRLRERFSVEYVSYSNKNLLKSKNSFDMIIVIYQNFCSLTIDKLNFYEKFQDIEVLLNKFTEFSTTT